MVQKPREHRRTFRGHLAFIPAIALVRHNQDGSVGVAFDPYDPLIEHWNLLERLAGRDGIDEQETLGLSDLLIANITMES